MQQDPHSDSLNREIWDHYARGVEKFGKGLYQESLEDFQRVLQIDPYFSMAYVYLSAVHTDTGQPMRGVALARKGLSIDPENNYLHYCLGVGYEKQGLFEEALEQYHIYDELIPNDAECAFSMGCTHGQLGQRKEAISCYCRAL